MSLVFSQDDVYEELHAILEQVNQKRDGVNYMGFAPSKGRRCENPISTRDYAAFKATLYEL